jgi:cellulose synthase (UDP-forming)
MPAFMPTILTIRCLQPMSDRTFPPPASIPLELPRRILVWVFLAISAWYLWWRAGTLNPEAPVFSAVVYGAELFGVATTLLHLFMCGRLTIRSAPPPRAGLRVDVFVPSYNESVELVRKTLLAARAMDYPHTTWLLDDGRRAEMQALAQQLGCRYLARADNAHAKAGNLNHGLAHSDAELVVIFDADHAPRRDFLLKTLGYFEDAAVGFVQTPQDFYNLDSYQHRRRGAGSAVWTEQSLFFRVIQRGKDYWNAAFFCGSCAVMRRSALDAIGGFATGTVTEDLHTSLRLHAKGYKSVYHAEALAFGLAPESIEPFIGQRVRWGQGAMHVWRMEGLLRHRGLSWAQRLNYLASVLTYFDGWQKAVFYIAPVIVLLTGTLPLLTTTPDFLWHFVPYYLLTFWVFEEVGRGYGRSIYIEQYNMARFAAFAWATLAWVAPTMKFRVTSKGASSRAAARFMAPQWVVMTLNFTAIPVAVALLLLGISSLPVDGLVANSVWALINGLLALAVISFTAVTQGHTRSRYRFRVPLAAEFRMASGLPLRGTVDDLSDTGLRFYGELPASLAVGERLQGQLELPDGGLPLVAEVRSLVVLPDSDGAVRAMGCSFSTGTEDRHRLESFLFGSDLQWAVNGYTDQVHTPMSRIMGAVVPGPTPHPLARLRWNAARLRSTNAAAAVSEPALVSAGDGETLLISYRALPMKQELELEVYRRTPQASRRVRLQAAELPCGRDASLYLYRLATSRPAAAPVLTRGPARLEAPAVAPMPESVDLV